MDRVKRWFLRQTKNGIVPNFDETLRFARKSGAGGAVRGVTHRKLQALRKNWFFTSLYSRAPAKVRHFQTIQIPKMGLIQADSAFMDKGEVSENDGYVGFMLFAEPATGLLFANPIKDKKRETYEDCVEEAMVSGVFRRFTVLQSDRDRSFTSPKFSEHLKQSHGVTTQFLVGFTKAWSVERAIRTVKTNLSILMDRKKTRRWLDLLPKIISHHNQRPAFGTTFKRNAITERTFLDYLDERFKSEDHTMTYAGSSRDYESLKYMGWSKKIFRFHPGNYVLLSVAGDYLNKKTFTKKSMRGTYSKTLYIVRSAALRASDKGHLVPG